MAGMEGRITEGGKAVKGHWFDMDAEIYDRDRLNVVISISDDRMSLLVRCSMKDGSTFEWSARRAAAKRDGGKLATAPVISPEVFARLTQPSAGRRPGWAETARRDILAATMRETSPTAALRSGDGAITYIPPLTVAEPYDESAPRKFYESTTRYRGRQMYGSVNIEGRPMTQPAAPAFPYISRPYMSPTDVARVLREERERREASLPKSLQQRQGFRPSSAGSARRAAGGDVYLSAASAAATEDELARLKRIAMEQGGWAETPRRPSSAGSRGRSGADTRLVKTGDGRLSFEFAKRPIIAPARADVLPLVHPEHLPDEYDRAKEARKREAEVVKSKMGARPAFSPVGPRLAFEVVEAEEPARPPSAGAGGAGGSRPGSAGPGGSRPGSPRHSGAAFVPYAGGGSASGRSSPYKDYPAYLPSPYVVFADGGMSLLRSNAPPVSLESPRPGSARSGRGMESPRSNWRPVSPGPGATRAISSVITHTLNLRRASKTGAFGLGAGAGGGGGGGLFVGGTAAHIAGSGGAGGAGALPPHSPLRAGGGGPAGFNAAGGAGGGAGPSLSSYMGAAVGAGPGPGPAHSRKASIGTWAAAASAASAAAAAASSSPSLTKLAPTSMSAATFAAASAAGGGGGAFAMAMPAASPLRRPVSAGGAGGSRGGGSSTAGASSMGLSVGMGVGAASPPPLSLPSPGITRVRPATAGASGLRSSGAGAGGGAAGGSGNGGGGGFFMTS